MPKSFEILDSKTRADLLCKKEKEIQMETILEIKEYVEDPPLDDEGMCFRDVIFANLVNCFEEVSTDGGYNEQT